MPIAGGVNVTQNVTITFPSQSSARNVCHHTYDPAGGAVVAVIVKVLGGG